MKTVFWSAVSMVLLAACGGANAPASSSPPASAVAVSASVPGKPSAAAGATPGAGGRPSPAAATSAEPPSAAAKASASELTRVTVSFPDGGAHVPLFYAQDKGLFAKYGLDVDLRPLGGGPPALAALQKGDVKMADISGSVISSADAQGVDIVALATLDPVYPYVLEAPASVKTPQDLKGKGIAVRAVGDATDIAARVSLQKLGLVPDKDVEILAVNTAEARIAAVKAGQICCTVAQPQDRIALEQGEGFHMLFDMATLGTLNAQGVIAAPRSYLTTNKGTVEGFLHGLVDAIAAEKQDRAGGVAEMKKMLKLDDDKIANALYDYFVGKVLPANPVAKPEQFSDGIAVLAQRNPKMKGFSMDKFVDPSFLAAVTRK